MRVDIVVMATALASKYGKLRDDGYDVFGCWIAGGETWCDAKRTCVTQYETCDPGSWDLSKCSYQWAGLTWDLSPLQKSTHYVVKDELAQSDVSYLLGLCMNVDEPEAACDATTGSAREVMTSAAAAYQVLTKPDGGRECFRCGSLNATTFGLLDPSKPQAGVYLRYERGNTCSASSPTRRSPCSDVVNGNTYCRRSMTVNVACNNRITDVQAVESVVEGTGCDYSIRLNSQYGCPLECPRSAGLVCHGRGECGYDGVEDGLTYTGGTGRARCLCKAPWTGDTCTDYVPPTTSSSGGGLLLAGTLTLSLGILLILYSKRDTVVVLLSGLANFGARDDDRRAKARRYQADDEDESSNPFISGAPRADDDGDVALVADSNARRSQFLASL